LFVWMTRRHRRWPSDGAQPGGSTCRRGCRCLPRVGDGKNRAGDTRSRFSSMLPRVLISFLWATEVTAASPECCSGRSADRSWPMLIAPQLSCAPRYRDLSVIAGNGNPRQHLCRADQLRSPRATSRRTVGSLQSRISAATGSVPYARSNVKGLHHSTPARGPTFSETALLSPGCSPFARRGLVSALIRRRPAGLASSGAAESPPHRDAATSPLDRLALRQALAAGHRPRAAPAGTPRPGPPRHAPRSRSTR
jgi:hypothetical protein